MDTQAPLTADSAVDNRFSKLEQHVTRLIKQSELERLKHLALMKLMIQRFDLGVVDAKSEFADISPIERMRGNGDFAVMAFAGLALGLSMPVAEFYRMSTNYGQTIYFVKDHHQAWYQRGLLGLSKDVSGAVEALRGVAGQETELRVMGASAGGFAALLFGVLLKASRVVAISPQTLLNRLNVNIFRSQDTRSAEVLGGSHLDLVPVLEKNEGTQIHLHYAKNHPVDVKAAERLRGLPHVTLYPHDCRVHELAAWLKAEGKLEEVLAPVFGEKPGAAAPQL